MSYINLTEELPEWDGGSITSQVSWTSSTCSVETKTVTGLTMVNGVNTTVELEVQLVGCCNEDNCRAEDANPESKPKQLLTSWRKSLG